MNALSLTIDREQGFLFEATHHRDVIVFVPAAVFSDCYDEIAGFDPGAYVHSGWAAKNARFNSSETSDYAFPVLDCPALRADERRVVLFLQRLRHAYAIELVTGCVN
jgi:hypothetical protein